MTDVLTQALIILAVIVLGHVVRRIGWLDEHAFGALATIVVRITLPALIITSFDRSVIDPGRLWIALVGLVFMVAIQTLAYLGERRRGREAAALGVLNTGTLNVGLFAIPYLASIIGPEAVLAAVLFDIGNTMATMGVSYAWGHGLVDDDRGRGWAANLAKGVRRSFSSPAFVTYLVMVTLRLFDLHLPAAVIGFTQVVANANTFLAMFMIGVGLELAWDRDRYATVLRLLGYRWAAYLPLAALTWFVLPLQPLDKVVVIVLLAAPPAASSTGFTTEAGLDHRVATLTLSVSVLIALVLMPLLLMAMPL